jgi:hypothetical protein
MHLETPMPVATKQKKAAAKPKAEFQNLTVRLSRETIRKARIVAAERSTSISGLVAGEIERIADERSTSLRARERAFANMEAGWDLGVTHPVDRDALHER